MPSSYHFEIAEHDSQDEIYRFPIGAAEAKSMVRMRFRLQSSESNVRVQIHTWNRIDGNRITGMRKDNSLNDGTYYVANIQMPEKGCLLWYYFIIEVNGRKVYYGNSHDKMGGIGVLSDGVDPAAYQITVYNEGAKTPDWFKHAVMYQIFPDRFNKVGMNFVEKPGAVYHACWEDPPYYYKDPDTKEIVNYDFYGGNLQGIKAKLPYLKDLGISVIYLNPIFEAASNHRYDTGDYKKVDPILGTEEDFKDLCDTAREMGIRIMLDGVFSHTGDDSIYFNRYGHYDSLGAYQSKDSKYYSWYNFREYPNNYESWWGFHTLPNVWEESPSYMDFIIEDKDSVLHHWLKCGISGWRLDVLDELPQKFSQSFYAELKKIDPNAVMLGEVWEDASNKKAYGVQREYLCGQETDSVMNYVFRQIVLDFALGHADAAQVSRRVRSMVENYPAQNLYAMMNLLGSHDRERILTLLGEAPSSDNVPAVHQAKYKLDRERHHRGLVREKMAVIWQMTFPGVPSVYYGDEIAMEGYRDPYSRCPYDWKNGDKELLAWYKKIIALRNDNVVLQTGKLDHLYAEGDVYGYGRSIEEGKDVFGKTAKNDVFVVLLNRGNNSHTVSVDVSRYRAERFNDVFSGDEFHVVCGKMHVTIPKYSGVILRVAKRSLNYPRMAGVLLHPTSLPSRYGIGDLGDNAFRFVDFLSAAGQKIWQMLPLNPIAYGFSPYSSPSAFAGNPYLIHLEYLMDEGYIQESHLHDAVTKPSPVVDFEGSIKFKEKALKIACNNFFTHPTELHMAIYEKFCRDNAEWLDDYALFVAIKGWYNGAQWTEWGKGFKQRDPKALEVARYFLKDEIRQEKFNQFVFDVQIKALRRYANGKGIKLMGDMPMFVAPDSADAWANQKLFALDHEGRPVYVTGVPPDYFSETGQNWGNPQYNWEAMKQDGYQWWIKRIKRILDQLDMVRIDHFRAFADYWEIPAGETTAINGQWKDGPGLELFEKVKEALGEDVPIVAEDLGSLSDKVLKLRDDTGFPGMRIIHFEMGPDDNDNINFVPAENSLVYTGTHDNNTTVGWLKSDASEATIEAMKKLFDKPHANKAVLCRSLIEMAYSTQARMAIIPAQDLLGLDGRSRMNTPGTVEQNWRWRMLPEHLIELSKDRAKWLKKLCVEYKR